MTIEETVKKMFSKDYKDRFRAEYWQLKRRADSLHKMIVDYEADELDFEPTCPLWILKEQYEDMIAYMCDLEARAIWEGVDLDE